MRQHPSLAVPFRESQFYSGIPIDGQKYLSSRYCHSTICHSRRTHCAAPSRPIPLEPASRRYPRDRLHHQPSARLAGVFGNHISYVQELAGVRNKLIHEYTCLPPLSRPNATEVHVYPATMDNWFGHPVRGQVSGRLHHDAPSYLCYHHEWTLAARFFHVPPSIVS